MSIFSPNIQSFRRTASTLLTAVGMMAILNPVTAHAAAIDQAKQIHDRIAGVPPTAADLSAMLAIMDPDGDGVTTEALAAEAAMAVPIQNKYFYNVTLKNWITPWTNEEQTVFAPLNDYTATVIGIIASSNPDFRRVLYDDVLFVGSTSLGLPAYSSANNNHYEALEAADANLGTALVETTQSAVAGLPSDATAGIITTRAGAKAFFVAGTNRAMFRFTMMNYLCNDLEQLNDITRPADRVRQDVSRSPGGDSRIFLNNCIGCHAGMDPLAQAFAFYEWTGEEGTELGQLEYTSGEVQAKYLINATTFKDGYITTDDHWTNYWREGPNAWIGWDAGLPSEGNGAKSLGMELANTNVFAECQVTKAFKAVCLRDPGSFGDRDKIEAMTASFKTGYNIMPVFAESAAYCMGL